MKPHRTLDTLLKDWAHRSAPDFASRRKLEAAVVARIKTRPHAPPSPAPSARSPVNPWLQLAWGATGLAVASLVLLACLHLGQAPRPRDPDMVSNGLEMDRARFSGAELDAHLLVLDELDRLFNGRLSWVRVGEASLDFDLAPRSSPASAQRVAVRLLVVVRPDPEARWQRVYSSDFLVQADDYITIADPISKDSRIGLWIHRLPDGHFVVDTEFNLDVRGGLSAHSSHVLSSGQPRRVARAMTPHGEVRVYQSIEPLASRKG